MGWVIGGVRFFGGLGILLGALFPVSVGLNVLNVGGLLVLGGLAGGIPVPLPRGSRIPRSVSDSGWDTRAVVGRAGQMDD
jgi:putative oxidoreductase